MPKKLLSLALAAAYFTVGACRFACAATMAAPAPLAAQATQAEGECHHAPKSKGASRSHERPCCSQSQAGAALLPSHPELRTLVLASALARPIGPSAPRRAFAYCHDPPGLPAQAVAQSAASPRAPPSLLAAR